MVLGQIILEVGQQLGQLLGEVIGGGLATVALEREHGQLIGAGRAAEREVDAPGVQAGQHRERLGDLERAVMGQHHAAAAHPQALGGGGDGPDQHLGAGAGQHRAAVVLGHPVAVIAERVGQPGQVERVVQRVGTGRPFGDRGLVKHGEEHVLDARKARMPVTVGALREVQATRT